MTSTWHQFTPTADGDESCDRCGVVLSSDAHLSFTLPCPSGDCQAGANPAPVCVFVPGRDGRPAACIYCGRSGTRPGDPAPVDLTALGALPDQPRLSAEPATQA